MPAIRIGVLILYGFSLRIDGGKQKISIFQNEASYAPIQIKFTIIKGDTVGTEFAAGWFIDNLELLVSMN